VPDLARDAEHHAAEQRANRRAQRAVVPQVLLDRRRPDWRMRYASVVRLGTSP
jgi:hypothetical protein